MRLLLALALLAPALLAGCAGEAPPRYVPVLEMSVKVRGNTTFEFGEVLGSDGGVRIDPFRFDDETLTLLAEVPEDERHLLLVHRAPEPVALLAGTTRAIAEANDPEVPAIFQFLPVTGGFKLNVVQHGSCPATVNAVMDGKSNITQGKGPFTTPVLENGDIAVVSMDGGPEHCPNLRLEVRNVGAWRVQPLDA